MRPFLIASGPENPSPDASYVEHRLNYRAAVGQPVICGAGASNALFPMNLSQNPDKTAAHPTPLTATTASSRASHDRHRPPPPALLDGGESNASRAGKALRGGRGRPNAASAAGNPRQRSALVKETAALEAERAALNLQVRATHALREAPTRPVECGALNWPEHPSARHNPAKNFLISASGEVVVGGDGSNEDPFNAAEAPGRFQEPAPGPNDVRVASQNRRGSPLEGDPSASGRAGGASVATAGHAHRLLSKDALDRYAGVWPENESEAVHPNAPPSRGPRNAKKDKPAGMAKSRPRRGGGGAAAASGEETGNARPTPPLPIGPYSTPQAQAPPRHFPPSASSPQAMPGLAGLSWAGGGPGSPSSQAPYGMAATTLDEGRRGEYAMGMTGGGGWEQPGGGYVPLPPAPAPASLPLSFQSGRPVGRVYDASTPTPPQPHAKSKKQRGKRGKGARWRPPTQEKIPLEEKYLQTDPFSMYKHNKKVLEANMVASLKQESGYLPQ